MVPDKIFSYGGGVQSTAALVLAEQGRIDFNAFVFCNVGEDSENSGTLTYIKDIVRPFVDRSRHLTLYELQRKRHGKDDTILGNLLSSNRSIGIPVYMSNGAPGNRSCTYDYKVMVVDQFLRKRGGKVFGAIVGLGISLDEFQRCTTKYNNKWKTLVYPLIDLRLTRLDCMHIIEDAGLPVPPKSSCWFCPFHSMSVWQEMREHQPEQFKKAVDLEQTINNRRANLGKDRVWLSRKLKPLPMATTDMHQMSFEDDFCDSGYCFL
jgi:hypothetical protein